MREELNVLTDTRYGKMLYNQNDSFIGKSLDLYGEWMQSEMEFLTPFVSFGGIVADVGAYIGTHTLFFSEAVGPKGIVVAFEPQQMMFQLLCANMAMNHILNVRAFNLAVDQSSGVVQIPDFDYRSSDHFGSAALNRFEGHPVEARTFDECAMPSLDLIKIDVEGSEAEVIHGAFQAIQIHQPFIYVEYQPLNQSEDLVSLLHSLDYDVYEHTASGFRPQNFKKSTDPFLAGYSETNLFCSPRSKGLMIDLPLKPE